MIVTIFLIIAMLCFLFALLEWPPPVGSTRLIAAGLFLWLLATLIQMGMK